MMHVTRFGWLKVVALALAAAPALAGAQAWQPVESQGLMSRYGEYVLLGGGITEFTDDDAKDAFDMGGAWDLRIGFGSRFYVGAEAAYVGSFRGAATDGGNDLLTNGAEGVIRLQYPWLQNEYLIEPFAFGGVGWSRVSLRDAPAGVEDSDDIGVIPFGAGIMVARSRFLVDARFTYRTSFSEDQIGGVGASPTFDSWGVTASIGYEF